MRTSKATNMKDLICDIIIVLAVLIIAMGAALWSLAEGIKSPPKKKHPINSPSDTYHIL